MINKKNSIFRTIFTRLILTQLVSTLLILYSIYYVLKVQNDHNLNAQIIEIKQLIQKELLESDNNLRLSALRTKQFIEGQKISNVSDQFMFNKIETNSDIDGVLIYREDNHKSIYSNLDASEIKNLQLEMIDDGDIHFYFDHKNNKLFRYIILPVETVTSKLKVLLFDNVDQRTILKVKIPNSKVLIAVDRKIVLHDIGNNSITYRDLSENDEVEYYINGGEYHVASLNWLSQPQSNKEKINPKIFIFFKEYPGLDLNSWVFLSLLFFVMMLSITWFVMGRKLSRIVKRLLFLSVYSQKMMKELDDQTDEENENYDFMILYDFDEISETFNALKSLRTKMLDKNFLINSLLQNVSGGVVLIGSSGDILFFNEVINKMFNLKIKQSQKNILYVDIEEIIRNNFLLEEWREIKNNETYQKNVLKTKNGLYLEREFIPIKLKNKEEFYYLFSFRDITKEKEIEDEKQNEKARVVQVEKLASLGEMAAGIAHEINNPISVILGASNVIKKEIKESTINQIKVENNLDKIKNMVNRISKIINGIRIISRDGSNDSMADTQLITVLSATLDICSERMRLKGIELHCDLSEMNINFMSKESEFSQVLLNLINNAMDAVMNLEERWIKIEVEEFASFFELSVIDSGKGISSEIADKIMTPFFTTKEIGKGTGLGLSISRGIIDRHGGKLLLDRSSGNTKFIIRLPKSGSSGVVIFSINDLIDAHRSWKNRITQYAMKQEKYLDHLEVCRDDRCDLGKWIYSDGKECDKVEELQQLRIDHAEFHQCVGNLIERINQGKLYVTDELLSESSEYYYRSQKVIDGILKIKHCIVKRKDKAS